MQLQGHRLVSAARLDWPACSAAEADPVLNVVIAGGRGGSLHGAAFPALVLIALRGALEVSLGDGQLALMPREVMVCEPGQAMQLRARAGSLWIAVLIPRGAGRHPLRRSAGVAQGEAFLVPTVQRGGSALLHAAIGLAREALRTERVDAGQAAAIADFALAITDQQARFDPLIARCPGRTLAQRRAVFVRLQRVQRYIRANSHLELDTAAMARRAHYSLSHFIRAYHRVFGLTPHAALVGHRLERAHALLGSSALAVGEVALASGFENRCAFSRVFKRHFGVTALEVRRGVAA